MNPLRSMQEEIDRAHGRIQGRMENHIEGGTIAVGDADANNDDKLDRSELSSYLSNRMGGGRNVLNYKEHEADSNHRRLSMSLLEHFDKDKVR